MPLLCRLHFLYHCHNESSTASDVSVTKNLCLTRAHSRHRHRHHSNRLVRDCCCYYGKVGETLTLLRFVLIFSLQLFWFLFSLVVVLLPRLSLSLALATPSAVPFVSGRRCLDAGTTSSSFSSSESRTTCRCRCRLRRSARERSVSLPPLLEDSLPCLVSSLSRRQPGWLSLHVWPSWAFYRCSKIDRAPCHLLHHLHCPSAFSSCWRLLRLA